MTSPKSSPPAFKVRRQELVAPARPTPREVKELSDIDDQDGLRYHLSFIQFYVSNPSMEGIDPARVIREALAQALVFYYPLAGRLREGPNRKLSVDCTGEGVLFVEADADVELQALGNPPEPPFLCSGEFEYHVLGAVDIFTTPLFAVEVTRYKCNGFTVAHRYTHAIADGFGTNEFLKAVAEIARGATAPSVTPVWSRHIFNARDPPTVTCVHPEHDSVTGFVPPFDDQPIVERHFFFGPSEVSALRSRAPDRLRHISTRFELTAACLWHCRIRAIGLNPDDEVRLNFAVNARGVLSDPPVPEGFYGNAFMLPAAVTSAGKLSFEHALELVRETKAKVTKEYIQSTADILVIMGRPYCAMKNSFFVSDATLLGFDGVDYGWGKPAFGGQMSTEEGLTSYCMGFENENGEVGRLVTIGLPQPAMDNFVKELDYMLGTN